MQKSKQESKKKLRDTKLQNSNPAPIMFSLLFLMIASAVPIYSLDISLTVEQHFFTDQDNRVYEEGAVPDSEEIEFQSQKLGAAAFHDFDTTDNEFSFIAGLSYYTDEMYSPSQRGEFYSGYYRLEKGGLQLKQQFPGFDFAFNVGRFVPSRLIDSPYSLFISSNSNHYITADFLVSSGIFFLRSQWLQLNKDSVVEGVNLNEYETTESDKSFKVGFNNGFPDRGANLRYYGVKLNDIRFGFLDAAVYTEKSFDLEYFINPLPGVLIQYASIHSGNPWLEGKNENYLFGFFLDYTQPDYYLYSQLFFDDVNTDFLFTDKDYTNPNKLAWSLGGKIRKRWVDIGFYHAGATEHMFQPSGSVPYGYTHYPDVLFRLNTSETASIPLEENYMGYVHGENNIAFMLTVESKNRSSESSISTNTFDRFDLKAALEFVLSGIKSPVNPWGPSTSWRDVPSHISMFPQKPLEKRLQFYLDTKKEFDLGFSLFSSLKLGYVWNKLQLEPAFTGEIEYNENLPEYDIQYLYYYKPSDISKPIARFTIGIEYSFNPEDMF